jgi:hypothetical protein
MTVSASFLMHHKIQDDYRIILPLSARLKLVEVAMIEVSEYPAGSSKRRTAAIDKVVKKLRESYPSAFWPVNEFGCAVRY